MPSLYPDTPLDALVLAQPEPWRAQLVDSLEANGVRVDVVSDSEELNARLGRSKTRLVLLDLNLPGGAALSICQRLSGREDLRVIALSAVPEEMDAVVTLEMGADDYVPKSSGPREIIARMRAQLRRAGRPREAGDLIYRFQGFRFDPVQRRLEDPHGAAVALTPCQASLLAALLRAPDQVQSRRQLIAFVLGGGTDVLEGAIDTQVSRLRSRLKEHGAGGVIETVFGLGYRWAGGPVSLGPAPVAEVSPEPRSFQPAPAQEASWTQEEGARRP
jgi:two-component system OmpR family response regulator